MKIEIWNFLFLKKTARDERQRTLIITSIVVTVRAVEINKRFCRLVARTQLIAVGSVLLRSSCGMQHIIHNKNRNKNNSRVWRYKLRNTRAYGRR